jgi:thioesterase domain-containing protein
VRSRRASGGVHEPDSDPLVLLRAGDADLPALFWVTGIGGLALAARRLADDVDPGMCVYSFDAALHRGASEPTSVADMADGYATRLVAATDGPFVVGGNSFGAMVAYVMACLLESRGRPPAGVVLVDPRLTLASHGWLVPRLWRYQVKTRERVSRWSRRLLRIPARRQRPPVPANVHAAKATNRALRSTFEPRSYGGDVTLVATRDRRMEHGRDLGLREFVDGEVTIVKLGGQHRGALSDHRLAILARATNEVLRRAQPAKQGGSARVSARDS